MVPYKWDLNELPDIVKSSTSIRQVLQKLGLKPAGGNYVQVRKAIQELNLNVSHFTGKGSNKGRTFGPKRPLSDYTEKGVPIQSNQLRIRLIKEGVFQPRCNNCGGTHWMGQDIPLELEHKDGNHHNNSLDNLELLCPNCHAQTSTYRGKNKRRA